MVSKLYIDLDSTLVINPLETYVRPRLYSRVSRLLGISEEELSRLLGSYHLKFASAGDIRSYDWDYLLEEILRDHGIDKSVLDDLSFENLLREGCSNTVVLDDAPMVLQRLRDGGYRLVLATNGLWKYQECVLKESGLLPYFHSVITPDKAGCLKSSRRFYEYDGDLNDSASVGDNLVFDIYYPKSYGMVTILVKRPWNVGSRYAEAIGINPNDIRPDYVVTDLRSLPELLEKI